MSSYKLLDNVLCLPKYNFLYERSMNIEPKSKKERAVKSRKRRRKTKTAMQKTKLQQQADSSQKLLRILKSMIQPTMWYKICTGKMTVLRAEKIIRLIILPITRSMRELSEPQFLYLCFHLIFQDKYHFGKWIGRIKIVDRQRFWNGWSNRSWHIIRIYT